MSHNMCKRTPTVNYAVHGPQQLTELSITTDRMIDKTIKEAYLIAAAIPDGHNLCSTIAEKLQKYADLKEQLTRLCQLNAVCK
jgi:hypothetical protein